ncbi:MAG: hypothetical protein ACMVO3_03745 [Thalassobaculum sp.]
MVSFLVSLFKKLVHRLYITIEPHVTRRSEEALSKIRSNIGEGNIATAETILAIIRFVIPFYISRQIFYFLLSLVGITGAGVIAILTLVLLIDQNGIMREELRDSIQRNQKQSMADALPKLTFESSDAAPKGVRQNALNTLMENVSVEPIVTSIRIHDLRMPAPAAHLRLERSEISDSFTSDMADMTLVGINIETLKVEYGEINNIEILGSTISDMRISNSSIDDFYIKDTDISGLNFTRSRICALKYYNYNRCPQKEKGEGCWYVEGLDFSNAAFGECKNPFVSLMDFLIGSIGESGPGFSRIHIRDLTGISFRNAKISSLDLSAVQIFDAAQFEGACVNGFSLLPESLVLPECD